MYHNHADSIYATLSSIQSTIKGFNKNIEKSSNSPENSDEQNLRSKVESILEEKNKEDTDQTSSLHSQRDTLSPSDHNVEKALSLHESSYESSSVSEEVPSKDDLKEKFNKVSAALQPEEESIPTDSPLSNIQKSLINLIESIQSGNDSDPTTIVSTGHSIIKDLDEFIEENSNNSEISDALDLKSQIETIIENYLNQKVVEEDSESSSISVESATEHDLQ